LTKRIALYPGSFDPIHYGHIDIVTRTLGVFDELVLGVYDKPAKNLMFSVEDRVRLARQALVDQPNVRVKAYGGLTVEFARQVGARTLVRGLRAIWDFELEYQMALMNYELAPEVEVICLMARQSHAFLSSSVVKEIALLGGDVEGMVPSGVAKALAAKRREREKTDQAPSIVSLRD
jgi:pantetheine-phosphate adenylyltransferase